MTASPRRSSVDFLTTAALVAVPLGSVLLFELSGPDRKAAAENERAQLAAAWDHLHQQVGASRSVVGELAEGRMTLTQAAAEVEQINADRDGFWLTLEYRFPTTSTNRARAARWILQEARTGLEHDPARLGQMMPRLEAEYAAAWPGQ